MIEETYNIKDVAIRSCHQSSNNVNFNYSPWMAVAPRFTYQNATLTSAVSNIQTISAPEGIYHVPMESAGDILLTVSWGSGFRTFQLNNNGTLAQLYSDNGDGYLYMVGLGVDPANKVAIATYYNRDNAVKYDFSANGWAGTPTKTILNTSNTTLPHMRYGESYYQGAALAGRWMYFSRNNTSTTNAIQRWNYNTNTLETLTFDYVRTGSTGRNHRYGGVRYDFNNDRIFMTTLSGNAGTVVVNNASTASPTVFCIDGEDNDAYLYAPQRQYAWEDPNDTNYLITGDNYRKVVRYNYSNIKNGTSAQISAITGSTNAENYRYYDHYSYFEARPKTFVDEDGRVWHCPDRGFSRYPKLIDLDNNLNYVGINDDGGGWKFDFDMGIASQEDDLVYDIRGGSDFQSSYGFYWKKMTTALDTTYYVSMGYGNDLDTARSTTEHPWKFNNSDPYFEFRNIQLSNQGNIEKILLYDIDRWLWAMNGVSNTITVSNNAGSTYETYDQTSTEPHTFSSTGNNVRIKITLGVSSNQFKCGYIFAQRAFDFTLYEKSAIDSNFVKFANLRIRR